MTTEPRTDDRGRPLCEGLTKRRTRCLATALPDSPFCEDHDPRDLRRGTHVSRRIAAHAQAMATREPVPPTSHRPWCDAAAHTDIGPGIPILCAGPSLQIGKDVSVRLREDERTHAGRIALNASASLTPKQARDLAAQLVALADTAEGRGPIVEDPRDRPSA